MDLLGPEQGPVVVSCAHGHDPSGAMKAGQFHE